jgi:multidrug efflux pump subunit AcrB
MWMTKISIKHPVFATMVMVGLMVLGLFSYRAWAWRACPTSRFPACGSRPSIRAPRPKQVENDVTRPIEEAVNTVGGIKTIRSNSWEGRAGVSVEFQLTTDMDRAVQDLRDKHRHRARRLPARGQGTRHLRQEGENAQPVLRWRSLSHERSLRDLSMLADQVIVKRIQAWPASARCASTASRRARSWSTSAPTSCAA